MMEQIPKNEQKFNTIQTTAQIKSKSIKGRNKYIHTHTHTGLQLEVKT